MRLERLGDRLDELRQPQHLADQRQLGLVREQRDVAGGPVLDPVGRLREDAGDARVGVLHVVDRVLGALPLRQLDVEVHVRVGGARDEVEARGVCADFLDDLAQGDDRCPPRFESLIVSAPRFSVTSW